MTVCFLGPDPIQSTQFIPGTNTPANGGQLFFYAAGSSTKQTCFKDNAAATPWTNPLVLDSGGNPPSGGEIWFPTGQTFKVVFAPSNDQDPPIAPYWSKDNLAGMNDTGSTVSEWVLGPVPTFISTTSFSLVGDQTVNFNVGRRVKSTNTGGTIFSTIINSGFGGGITTVTVDNDAGVLDAGLSVVSYGIVSAVNTSDPLIHGCSSWVATSAAGLTTTWIAPVGTAWVSGAGGGGAGGNPLATVAAGAGGGSGAIAIKQQVSLLVLTQYTIVLGAGGNGAVATATNGSSTSLTGTSAVLTLGGGFAATTLAASTSIMVAGASSGTNGQIGGSAFCCSTVAGPIIGGSGGSTPWGNGGFPTFATLGLNNSSAARSAGNGLNGSGGGGGAQGAAAASVSGGNGGAGILIIEW